MGIGGCSPLLARSEAVLAALNIGAVLIGLASAGLTATVVGLIVGFGLNFLGVDSGPDIGLVVGVLSGLVAGGWMAGSVARHSPRFHGAVMGLLFAALIVVIARLGGGPEATGAVVLLAVISAVVAGVSGWLAGRRKTRRIGTASPSDGRRR